MKIYVASSWRNEFQPQVVQALRAEGHEVYDFRNPEGQTGFSWASIDPEWENWTTEDYKKALSHPLAEKGFASDFNAMKWADCCVMVLPCGRSANTEAGWMKGAGKLVYVFSPIKQEPELMYKIYDGIADSTEVLVNMLADCKQVDPFAKTFIIDGTQVLVTKEERDDKDDPITCEISQRIIVKGTEARIALGYEEEQRRDREFDAYDEAKAKLFLDWLLPKMG